MTSKTKIVRQPAPAVSALGFKKMARLNVGLLEIRQVDGEEPVICELPDILKQTCTGIFELVARDGQVHARTTMTLREENGGDEDEPENSTLNPDMVMARSHSRATVNALDSLMYQSRTYAADLREERARTRQLEMEKRELQDEIHRLKDEQRDKDRMTTIEGTIQQAMMQAPAIIAGIRGSSFEKELQRRMTIAFQNMTPEDREMALKVYNHPAFREHSPYDMDGNYKQPGN
jgi:hypothetical protein